MLKFGGIWSADVDYVTLIEIFWNSLSLSELPIDFLVNVGQDFLIYVWGSEGEGSGLGFKIKIRVKVFSFRFRAQVYV